MMENGIYSPLSTHMNETQNIWARVWIFCNIVWIFVAVCNNDEGVQHIQTKMSPMCQN